MVPCSTSRAVDQRFLCPAAAAAAVSRRPGAHGLRRGGAAGVRLHGGVPEPRAGVRRSAQLGDRREGEEAEMVRAAEQLVAVHARHQRPHRQALEASRQVSEHRSRKGNGQPRRRRSTPTSASLSEIALLGEGDSSVRNGYYYEWASKKARNYLSPDSAEHSEKASEVGEGYTAKCRRVFARAHVYNINSISNNCDGETFVSADDLRINLWHLEVTDQCFNVVDMKPADMEDLVEVITSAEFHPSSCSLLAFGSSRGFVRLVDLRQSALCDRNVRIFQDRGNSVQPRTLFTEIISCISDVKFTGDGKYLLTRDYMNLKLWDLRVESSPVATYKVHEFLRPKLSELYNNDCIFDRFSCCSSKGGDYFATGSYSNTFKIFSRAAANPNGTTLEASTNPYRIQSFPSAKSQGLLSNFARGIQRKGQDGPRSDGREDTKCNMTSKVTHLAWHPMENFIVCAANNSLYMYHT
nr:serine/threonine protein phosphatase 2A 55 kDa regulatory subunit B alpha isoform isoform X2 [Oryza sativa Japonica Group]